MRLVTRWGPSAVLTMRIAGLHRSLLQDPEVEAGAVMGHPLR
jgi:hypothetical protein